MLHQTTPWHNSPIPLLSTALALAAKPASSWRLHQRSSQQTMPCAFQLTNIATLFMIEQPRPCHRRPSAHWTSQTPTVAMSPSSKRFPQGQSTTAPLALDLPDRSAHVQINSARGATLFLIPSCGFVGRYRPFLTPCLPCKTPLFGHFWPVLNQFKAILNRNNVVVVREWSEHVVKIKWSQFRTRWRQLWRKCKRKDVIFNPF